MRLSVNRSAHFYQINEMLFFFIYNSIIWYLFSSHLFFLFLFQELPDNIDPSDFLPYLEQSELSEDLLSMFEWSLTTIQGTE